MTLPAETQLHAAKQHISLDSGATITSQALRVSLLTASVECCYTKSLLQVIFVW